MKRLKKEKKSKKENKEIYKKNIYEIIGVSPEIISDEVKIVVVGDYLVEFHNHNGIIDMTDEYIKINTKRNIYTVFGDKLIICSMTDEQLDIKGKINSLVRE